MSRFNQSEPTLEHAPIPKPLPPQRHMAATSRPKVAFVEGTRPRFSAETAALLRSRLRAATLVLSIFLAVAFAANLFSDYAPLVVIRASIVAAFVASYLILRSPRPFALIHLRCFEAALFGALVVQLLLMMGSRLAAFAKLKDAVSLVAAEHAYLSGWAILILTYGILMPNTWRRALARIIHEEVFGR